MKKNVEMQEDEKEVKDPLIRALDKLGEGSGFLWMVFLFTMIPSIFGGMHSNTYIFIAEIPTHWCAVPELSRANWTGEQIRNVSSSGPCTKYDYDYARLAEMDFEESLKYAGEHHESAGSLGCDEYNYADDVERDSLVEEWDLVCDRAAQRATTHMALSLGKLVGAGILGVSADKYGRRSVYSLGILLFVIAGPASAFIPWYWGFVLLRFITGISFSAVLSSSLTTLTEVAGNTHRQWMAISYNCGFASGSIFVAGISYLAGTWRQVQVATSLPSLILLLFMWYMPESPRWLVAQGRREEARRIIEKFYGPVEADPDGLTYVENSNGSARSDSVTEQHDGEKVSLLMDQIRGLRIIFCNCELQKRAWITFFAWMTASLTYYGIALNVDNFAVNYYMYAVFMGLTEIPSYLVPSPMLTVLGRRQASSMLFTLSGILLLTILSISRSATVAIIVTSLVARFCLSAAYGILILYTSELFPTIARTSALGTSSMMAHVGSIAAPYVVDFLGTVVWWGPSTLCGSLALVAGFVSLALPETSNRPLADSVEQEVANGRGVVSFTQGFKCGSKIMKH